MAFVSLSSHLQTFPLLETKRLVLRQLERGDAKDSFLFLSDEETMRFYDPPFTCDPFYGKKTTNYEFIHLFHHG